MALTSDNGARLPVRVRLIYDNGDIAFAPCREADAIRFSGGYGVGDLVPHKGFVVDAGGPVDAFTADCIAYALNEGPDDMESGNIEADGDGVTPCHWVLEREHDHPPRTSELMPREFPHFPLDTLPEFPEGFECGAWHNDTCPVFYEGTSDAEPDGAALMIAVDYAEVQLREFPDTPRYGLHIREGGDWQPCISSDDWAEIRAGVTFIRAVRDMGLGFHVDTRGRDYVGENGGRVYTDEQADALDDAIETISGVTDPYELTFRVWGAMELEF
jgi:hypothetical protein